MKDRLKKWFKKWFKNIKWTKGAEWFAELIIVICSFPIWFPILCYKYGLVYSDNAVKKFIEDDKGRK